MQVSAIFTSRPRVALAHAHARTIIVMNCACCREARASGPSRGCRWPRSAPARPVAECGSDWPVIAPACCTGGTLPRPRVSEQGRGPRGGNSHDICAARKAAIGPERQFAASQQYSRWGACGHTSSILRWCTTRYSKPPAGLFMAGHHPKQTEARNRARKEEAIRAECLLCLPSIDGGIGKGDSGRW
jgi:hypothetical protein